MLQSWLFRIKDHRRRQGQRYQLGHILLFAIFAILSGATSYRKIQAFMRAHYATLDEVFALHWKQPPAHTTIRSLIHDTAPAALEASFRAYSADLAAYSAELAAHPAARRFVGFDGKVLRGSFDHFQDQKALQVLSAFLAAERIILAHEEIAEKTNEIPTAQTLIADLGLTDCIFTLDALHCQEKTLEAAHATGNQVIVQVKDNQPTLLQDCQVTAERQLPTTVYQEPPCKTHGRIESRTVEVFTQPHLTDPDKWARVAAIVKVERHRLVLNTRTKCWQRSDETSFYIATTVLPAHEFCVGIRGHWGIENRDHYVRDVTLGEDRSRIRTNPQLFAKLRSFALNILRVNHVENVSLELFNNCMNLDRIMNYVGIR